MQTWQYESNRKVLTNGNKWISVYRMTIWRYAEKNMTKIPSRLFSRPSAVVVASTIGISLGITSTVSTVFSLFLVPISTEFGAARSSVSVVLVLIAIANALMFPIIGRLADRYSARLIIVWGLLFFVLSIGSVSKVQSLTDLYIAYSVIGITGSVLGPILFSKIIAGWFDKNRGLFLGVIGGVGNGVGSALMPIYVFILMSNVGWRGAYQGIAALIFILGVPTVIFLLRDPPKKALSSQRNQPKKLHGFTLREARATPTFWWVLVSISLYSGCLLGVFIHVIPILTDRGIALSEATTVLATFAMVTVVGQVAVGALLDRVNRPLITVPLFAVAVLGVAIFASTSNISLLIFSAVLMGSGLGAEFGLLPYCISRYFGLKDYGSISGLMYGVVAITTGFIPVLMDLIFDLSGDYDIAIIAIIVGMLSSAAMIVKLPTFDSLETTAVKPKIEGALVQE
jgi:MFS family permease